MLLLVSHGGKQKKKTNMLRGRKQTKRPMCNVLHGKSRQRAPCAPCYMTESRQRAPLQHVTQQKANKDPHAQHTHYTAEGTDNPHNALAAGKTCKTSCHTKSQNSETRPTSATSL